MPGPLGQQKIGQVAFRFGELMQQHRLVRRKGRNRHDAALRVQVGDINLEIVEAGFGHHANAGPARGVIEMALGCGLVECPGEIFGDDALHIRALYNERQDRHRRLGKAMIERGGRIAVTARTEQDIPGLHQISLRQFIERDACQKIGRGSPISRDIAQLMDSVPRPTAGSSALLAVKPVWGEQISGSGLTMRCDIATA